MNIVYLNEKEKISRNLLNAAHREDGTAILDLKTEIGANGDWNIEVLHFWFYLSSFYLGGYSESIYIKNSTKIS